MANLSLHRRLSQTWTDALIGGLASIPLTLGNYWLFGSREYFSLNMVFFGGVLAGYLAKRHSVSVGAASVRAGLIGGIPALAWVDVVFVDYLRDVAASWAITPAIVIGIMVCSFLLALSGLSGRLGGFVGSWLATTFGGQSTASAGG